MQFNQPSDLLAWSFPRDMGSADRNDHFALYYSSFRRNFGPMRRHKYDWQLRRLTESVRSNRVKSVLDVGCGCGTVSHWLALQGASVTGIDLEAVRLEIAQYRGRELRTAPTFKLANLFAIDETFDAIWIEQAFHHIEPRAEIWQHLAKRLNPGGQLYISDSNGWNPLVQAQLFKHRGLNLYYEHTDESGNVHPYGNERITVPAALTKNFGKAGVRKLALEYFGVLPNAPWAERLAVVERVIPRLLVPAFSHYLWVGERS